MYILKHHLRKAILLCKMHLTWLNELWKNKLIIQSFVITAEKTYVAVNGFAHTVEKKYLNSTKLPTFKI